MFDTQMQIWNSDLFDMPIRISILFAFYASGLSGLLAPLLVSIWTRWPATIVMWLSWAFILQPAPIPFVAYAAATSVLIRGLEPLDRRTKRRALQLNDFLFLLTWMALIFAEAQVLLGEGNAFLKRSAFALVLSLLGTVVAILVHGFRRRRYDVMLVVAVAGCLALVFGSRLFRPAGPDTEFIKLHVAPAVLCFATAFFTTFASTSLSRWIMSRLMVRKNAEAV